MVSVKKIKQQLNLSILLDYVKNQEYYIYEYFFLHMDLDKINKKQGLKLLRTKGFLNVGDVVFKFPFHVHTFLSFRALMLYYNVSSNICKSFYIFLSPYRFISNYKNVLMFSFFKNYHNVKKCLKHFLLINFLKLKV